MGDNGQLYVQPDVIPLYKKLMKFAKAITPNQFEAEYVLICLQLTLFPLQRSWRQLS